MGGNEPDIAALKERLACLERENRELSGRNRELGEYLRAKTNRLLELMRCPNLGAERFDDRTLLELDPIGTVAESFSQVLDHLREMNENLQTEIDERRKTEEALREKEELFRTVTEFASDWIFWRKNGGGMVYVAPACEPISGYAPEEFYGDPNLFFRVVHPGDRDAWVAHCHSSDERGVPGEMEFRILTKNGETRWLSHTCRPIFNEKGDFLGVRGSNRDITRNKKLEEEVLTARKLEAIGVLAGGIAHDFNNLLTVILGNIFLLKHIVAGNNAAHGRLEEAEKASLRARDLTNRLITFASGGAPVRETVSIAGLVEEVCELAVRGANVRCETLFPEGLPPVNVDKGQIRQVFGSLVVNACEAMPDGGTIRIRATCTTGKEKAFFGPAEEFVEITVEDQGVGIAEEHLRNVFAPFFTTKEKKSGLGLAAAYSIVQQHGGHIAVESRVGKGTVFTIRLPSSPVCAASESQGARPVPGAERRKILVMDDDQTLRAVVIDILDTIGYQGTAVSDGLEAIEAYRCAKETGEPFAALIMDLTVPGGMGGTEAIEKILEIDPDVRAIVSSGYSNNPVMSDHERYGFRGVIAKPYRIQELRDVLDKVILEKN